MQPKCNPTFILAIGFDGILRTILGDDANSMWLLYRICLQHLLYTQIFHYIDYDTLDIDENSPGLIQTEQGVSLELYQEN